MKNSGLYMGKRCFCDLKDSWFVIAHSHLERLPQGLAAYGIYGCDIKIARLVCLRH